MHKCSHKWLIVRKVLLALVPVLFLALPVAGEAEDVFKTKPLAEDGIHDPENDAIRILQEPGEAMIDFPLDRRGQIDWVKAIRSGKVTPRASLGGTGGNEMMEMDMDIIRKNTASMPHVRFPHLAHTQWLACSNCHPEIFTPQYNSNPISMEKILKGEYCGRCHDKVAFSLFVCERCHSVPHEGAPAWWDTSKK
jgi:c(7)-type cytochrome triheme protein